MEILYDATPLSVPNFEDFTETLVVAQAINHVQSRPHNHGWRCYYVAFPFQDPFGKLGEIMVGVSTTGEQIQSVGRVFEGEAVSGTTVELPSFTQLEFEEVKGKLEYHRS